MNRLKDSIGRTQEEALRELRSSFDNKGSADGAYIFPDSCLFDLLEKEPKTIEELIGIKGFPVDGQRVKKYGKQICTFFSTWPPKGVVTAKEAQGVSGTMTTTINEASRRLNPIK